jgi:DNA-directed RNA polymerase specialized sigma24 family protein
MSIEAIKAVNKARRSRAHSRLMEWAESRAKILESLGWSSVSSIASMSSGSGAGDDELNMMERRCDKWAQVLQTERLVRDMPIEWKVVIYAVYLDHQTQEQVADRLFIDRKHAMYRIHDAQDRLMAEVEAMAIGSAMNAVAVKEELARYKSTWAGPFSKTVHTEVRVEAGFIKFSTRPLLTLSPRSEKVAHLGSGCPEQTKPA